MTLMICAEIVARFFYRPIEGTYEIVGFLAAIMISLAMAYTQVERGHIAIEILVSRLAKRTQATIDAINWFISIILFALITWRLCVYAADLRHTGQLSATLWWPLYPFVYVVALGSAGLCLVLFVDFYKSLLQVIRK